MLFPTEQGREVWKNDIKRIDNKKLRFCGDFSYQTPGNFFVMWHSWRARMRHNISALFIKILFFRHSIHLWLFIVKNYEYAKDNTI